LAVKCGEHREGERKVNGDAKVDEREADGGELDEAVSVSEDEELGASEGGAEVGEVKNGVVENGDVEEGEIVESSTEEGEIVESSAEEGEVVSSSTPVHRA
jgi:hypothetical protein